MIIKELKIKNFGAIVDKTFNFDDKLEVFSAENEFGKTTCIEAMKRGIYSFSKLKNYPYIPLSGDHIDFSLELQISDEKSNNILVTRRFASASPTGKILNLGEENSKPIAIKNKPIMDDLIEPELWIIDSNSIEEHQNFLKNIKKSNISIFESINYKGRNLDDMLKDIEKEQKEIYTNSSNSNSKIKKNERKIAQIIDIIPKIIEKENERQEEYKNLIALENRKETLLSEIKEIKDKRKKAEEKLKIHLDVENAKKRLDSLNIDFESEIDSKKARKELDNYQLEISKIERLEENSSVFGKSYFITLFAILLLSSTLAFFYPVLAFLPALLGVFYTLFKISQQKKKDAEYNELLDKIDLSKYGELSKLKRGMAMLKSMTKPSDELIELIQKDLYDLNEYQKILREYLNLSDFNDSEGAYDELNEFIQNMDDELGQKNHDLRHIIEESTRLDERTSKEINVGIAEYQGLMVDEIKAEKTRLEQENLVLAKEYKSLEIKKMILTRTFEILKSELKPSFVENADKYLHTIDDDCGVYIEYSYSSEIVFRDSKEGEILEFSRLSTGTGAQVVLALKIAYLDEIDPDGFYPLIIDDAFMAYDSERKNRALNLLNLISEKRQVLYFETN